MCHVIMTYREPDRGIEGQIHTGSNRRNNSNSIPIAVTEIGYVPIRRTFRIPNLNWAPTISKC